MRLAPLLALAIVGCVPESHTLLSADGGVAPSSDDPVGQCNALQDQDIHGWACGAEAGGCSSGVDPIWWAGCNQPEGEFLAVRGESTFLGEQTCDDPVGVDLTGGVGLAFDSVDGPCFQIHRCDSDLRWNLCQAPGRTTLRDDAVATPFADCESAIASARDGDPCTPGLRCAGRRQYRPNWSVSIVLYCDDDGISRLIAADGFWFAVR